MKKIIMIFVLVCFFFQCKKELLPEFSEFTDSRDGYTYETVKIGTQVWLAENLRYLPIVNHPDDRSITEKKYYVAGYYASNLVEAKATSEYEIYGALYNYPAALEACPYGWHLPGEDEWVQLTKTVGRNNGAAFRSKMLWTSDMRGDNSSGFNMLPGTNRDGDGIWSTGQTSDVAGRVYVWAFPWSDKRLEHDDTTRDSYNSIRCIKD